jgi:hypothetical protein
MICLESFYNGSSVSLLISCRPGWTNWIPATSPLLDTTPINVSLFIFVFQWKHPVLVDIMKTRMDKLDPSNLSTPINVSLY